MKRHRRFVGQHESHESRAEALWYVESHLSGELSLEQVAAQAGVSGYHLTRAFGTATGMSVMRYVRRRRLTEAARKLACGERDILTLALDLSYQSHGAFSRAFREQFGVTPESVRRRGDTHNLNLLEAHSMEQTRNVALGAPDFVDNPELLLAGLSEQYDFETSARIPSQWQRFNDLQICLADRVGTDAYGVVCNADADGHFDYLCAVQVSGFGAVGRPYDRLKLPAQRYV